MLFRLAVLFAFAVAPFLAAAPGLRVEICARDVPPLADHPAVIAATETYTEDAFGLFALPQKYVSTGVRADRAVADRELFAALVTEAPAVAGAKR
jgi:hypothetical protein